MPRGIPRSKEAAHNPVIISKVVETSQQDINQGQERVMSSTGPAEKALDSVQNLKIMDRLYDAEKMAMLDFMNEPIEIKIATAPKDKEQCFEINVNGHLAFFRRGETKTVKRFIVDRMLRLKETTYSQQEVVNSDGIKQMVYLPHTSLKYDFSITRDDNPLGRSWESGVLMEPG